MVKNFGELFLASIENYGERAVLEWKENDRYESLSGDRLRTLVYETAMAFEKLGLQPNDTAAIISESRFEWIVADFACIYNRIITIPIYTTMTPEQTGYILRHSGCKVCFVSTELMFNKVNSVMHSLPDLKKIICFNEIGTTPAYVMMFQHFISKGDASRSPGMPEETEYLRKKAEAIKEDDLLTIIYTSGTTGVPKGVCLTHKNILTNIMSCQKAFDFGVNDVFLSFLPLAHSYERTTGYYTAFSEGAKISYARSIDTISRQMTEVKPTIITAVPLFLHRMHARVLKSTEGMSFVRRYLFRLGLRVAGKYGKKKRHVFWKLFDILVYHKIRNKLGGRLRFIVSGGSALNKETAKFFDSLGVKLLEGYGMTEASPVISANREDNNMFGTVGIPLDGVTVRIADDGEILVKGGNVMAGYYKEPQETKKTIIDGWLHTGDIGELDGQGRLKISDRKKTLFKTEGGKYISLTHIEEAISKSPVIDQVIVFGGDRAFVTALIVPDFDELKNIAREKNIAGENEGLTAHTEIVKLFGKEIEENQKELAKYERVRRFTLMPKPFTIESGELTPTLKIKRKVVEEKFRDVIENMYRLR